MTGFTRSGNEQQAQTSGSVQDRTAEEIYTQIWAIIRDGELEQLSHYLTDDFRFSMPGAVNVSRDEMIQIAAQWRQAFSGFGQRRFNLTTITDEIAERAAIRDQHILTHDGDFRLPSGETIPASGNEITIYGAHFVLVEDGRLSKWDIYFDTADMIARMRGESTGHSRNFTTDRNIASEMGTKGGHITGTDLPPGARPDTTDTTARMSER